MATPFARPENLTALLAAIVDSSDDAIVSKTLEGVITSWNAGAERIFGYTAAEAVGQSITLIIPPDRLDEERDILARIARGESVKHLQTVRLAKGGRPLDISVTVSAVRDADGRVIGASKVARDIGERVRAAQTQALMSAIVDSSDDAIVSKTLEGVIQSWNRGAERLFGYTAAEAVGRHVTLIIPSDRHAEEDDVLARIRRGETVDHYETVRVRKDGREIAISLTVSPMRDSSGRIIGASKIARDISERHRIEAERVALLEREQQAREEAEMLNRSKDQFLAVLSHELRTPLNAIYGWARLLHDGSIDAGLSRHAAEVIVRNARTQLQLVEDLLDVSRIVTGTMRLDLQLTDLAPLVGDCVDSIRPLAGAKRLEIGVALAADAIVMGAPDRLRQVVSNLLTNATKFTPEGGRIDVELRDAGDDVELVVRDTGEGIGPELLPHIFDRFRQGDSSSTRAHGGLGLGLALVRHLVELHGGSVRAQSEGAERGATFVISLPRAAAAVVPANQPPATATGLLRGVRALVVDDDADSVELTRTILNGAGADVRVSLSPRGVTETASEWSPTVLVLDIEMPGEDGYGLLARLRLAGVQAPALALTAYSRPEDRRRALAAGFAMFLSKPVAPEDLVAAVARFAEAA